MCNVAAIGLGLTAVSTISQVQAAQQQQDAYADYQVLQSQAALTNYVNQANQLNNRYAQEAEANYAEREQIRLENMKAKATAQASAASSGVEGLTIDNLFAGYDRATAVSNYAHARNLQFMGIEYNDQLQAYRNQALSSIYSMQQYQGATAGSTLLAGLGGMMTQYANYESKKIHDNWYKSNTLK